MNSLSEVWRPIPGWEDLYEVSNLGRVRSLDRTVFEAGPSRTRRRSTGRLIKQSLNKPGPAGRWKVRLSRDGRQRQKYVHALVLEAFIGTRPKGFDGCHNDGNRDDNRLSNLRWDTKSNNSYDRVRHGNHFQTHKTHCPHGHPYTEENTTYTETGARRCRTCTAKRSRENARKDYPRKRAIRMQERGDLFGVHWCSAKTHCKRGHPLSGENLYVIPKGGRDCRTCRREALRRSRSKAV